jgi:hypothetical protein
VNEQIEPAEELTEPQTRLLGETMYAAFDRLGAILRRRGFFSQCNVTVLIEQREVGKGAADVDTEYVIHSISS